MSKCCRIICPSSATRVPCASGASTFCSLASFRLSAVGPSQPTSSHHRPPTSTISSPPHPLSHAHRQSAAAALSPHAPTSESSAAAAESAAAAPSQPLMSAPVVPSSVAAEAHMQHASAPAVDSIHVQQEAAPAADEEMTSASEAGAAAGSVQEEKKPRKVPKRLTNEECVDKMTQAVMHILLTTNNHAWRDRVSSTATKHRCGDFDRISLAYLSCCDRSCTPSASPIPTPPVSVSATSSSILTTSTQPLQRVASTEAEILKRNRRWTKGRSRRTSQ